MSGSTIRLTIRRKVFLLVLLPIFLVVSLITLYSFIGNRSAASDQIKRGLTEKAQNYASRVDYLLRQVGSAGEVTAQFLSDSGRVNEDDLYEMLRRTVSGNSLIHGAALAFEPGVYPQRKRFSPYVYRDGENYKTIDIGEDANLFAEQALDWYDTARLKAASTWSEPYRITKTVNTALITFSTPIFRAERIIGACRSRTGISPPVPSML